ncbi:hypothetical protein DH2020_033364 [Rehmannia glutinosa]|uniref:Uncharacterized protein n=1 Tax=Rehmannia glutinosa TaxID=99300 RepID=A0ABR0VFM4_REHGL
MPFNASTRLVAWCLFKIKFPVKQIFNFSARAKYYKRLGRGRPRKDPSLKRSTAAHATPGFDVGAEQYLPQRADRTNGNESMVGQAVSGVVEATFDAKTGRLFLRWASPLFLRWAGEAMWSLLCFNRLIFDGLPISSQPPSGGPQSGHLLAFGDKDVHMVEPLSMLPRIGLSPPGQIFLGTQHHTSHRVEQNENGRLMEAQTSDLQTENGKEELKFSAEDSGVVSTQETGNTNEPFSTESLQTASVAKPFFNYGTGRMTELLQALQENMKENQVQFSEQPTSGSKVELRGTMTTENDPKNEASVQ